MDSSVLQNELAAARLAAADLSESPSTTFTFRQRVTWLERFGLHSMAYSLLQEGMQYFDKEGIGFIAYQEALGERVVLADPVCDAAHYETLLGAFLANGPRRVSFVQLSTEVADLLAARFGYHVTEFGQETVVELSEWSLRGKKKQIFRTALNQARAQGIEICEAGSQGLEDRISADWLQTRRCKAQEIRFLIRPKDMPYRKDVRCFYAFQNDMPIAFIHFDPLYEAGRIVGYVPNISRANAGFRQGLFYAMMAHALVQFQAEGVERVNLGLSPLALSENRDGLTEALRNAESTWLRRLFVLTTRFGQRLYNFSGIRFTKQRFQGMEKPVYVASTTALPLKAFLACLKLSRLV